MTDEELNSLVARLDDMSDISRDHAAGLLDLGHKVAVNQAITAITTLRAQLSDARAERDDALRGKECFQRMTRAHWDALCAMRNEINEYIPMPSTDSGPLFSPEDGPIYADIAERVIADLKENRAYALALEVELKARADRAEAALAAQIELDAKTCETSAYTSDGDGYHFAHLIRSQPHGRTALDRYREKALREAYDSLFKHPGFIHAISGQKFKAVKLEDAAEGILALIEKPNAS